jgi:hypothetical protein
MAIGSRLAHSQRNPMPHSIEHSPSAANSRRLVERELTLAEMLADPIVQLVMRRDRVHPETVTALFKPSAYRDAA